MACIFERTDKLKILLPSKLIPASEGSFLVETVGDEAIYYKQKRKEIVSSV